MRLHGFQYLHIFQNFLVACSCVCGLFLLLVPSVWGVVVSDPENPACITFRLVDTGQYSIERVSLMKKGESGYDGMSRQYQQISYTPDTKTFSWNPCNDQACTVVSIPGSGGKTGRDELLVELTVVNPSVAVESCYGDPVCERLQGSTRTISGMLDGFFHTGKTYDLSVSSLKAGIGESFTVTEASQQ